MVAVFQAEQMFGTRRFLMLYFGAGVFSNACTFASGRSPYSLGASGCIFGLVGAFAAFYYKNRKSLGSVSTAGDLTYSVSFIHTYINSYINSYMHCRTG